MEMKSIHQSRGVSCSAPEEGRRRVCAWCRLKEVGVASTLLRPHRLIKERLHFQRLHFSPHQGDVETRVRFLQQCGGNSRATLHLHTRDGIMLPVKLRLMADLPHVAHFTGAASHFFLLRRWILMRQRWNSCARTVDGARLQLINVQWVSLFRLREHAWVILRARLINAAAQPCDGTPLTLTDDYVHKTPPLEGFYTICAAREEMSPC